MPKHHVVRILPYTPDQLFALVGDVARYPEFVPWITSMDAEPAAEEGKGVSVLDAEAGVGFSFLKERFSTRVRRNAAERRIDVSLLRGPFRRLTNVWRFTPEGEATRIDFDIDFAFKTRLLDVVLQANFDRAVGRLIACFEGRAAILYGHPVERAGEPLDPPAQPG